MLCRIIAVALVAATMSACSPDSGSPKYEIIVFHAGSLSVPLTQIAADYERAHPDIRIALEAAGSRTCARKITDLNLPCDVFLSADFMVIENLLIPDYADWYVAFATNEIVLAYRDGVKEKQVPTEENVVALLLDPDSRYGRSDPDADPAGYRTLQSLQLIEMERGTTGVAAKLVEKDARFVRPKSADLIALLETRAIDYAFVYRSVAEQHAMAYLRLSDTVNLSNPSLADIYSQARVDVSGDSPQETIALAGIPIVYAGTIPHAAPNPEHAVNFLAYFLSRDGGQRILEEQHQTSLVPAATPHYDQLPDALKPYAMAVTRE